MKPGFDNQGRNLEGVKKHFDTLERMHREGADEATKRHAALVAKFPLADWVMFDNVLVLRCGKSRFVACPRSGKKSAKNFDVIDIVKREPVTMLKASEVYTWLWHASQNAELEATGSLTL